MSEQRITIEIKYDNESNPEICAGMDVSELADEFYGKNEIVAVAFYGALTEEEE